jgi:hypothetical protein
MMMVSIKDKEKEYDVARKMSSKLHMEIDLNNQPRNEEVGMGSKRI